jgi:ATP-dependent DNA ligase
MPGRAAGESPGFIAPMLATAVAGLPADAAEFVAEVKWDGLRACIAVAGGQVRAWSRSGRDITTAYPELGVLAAASGRRTPRCPRRSPGTPAGPGPSSPPR